MQYRSVPSRPVRVATYGDGRRNSTCLRWLGAFGTGLGIIGLSVVLSSRLPPMSVFGTLLLLAGTAQFACVYIQRGWRGALITELIAVLYLAAGLVIVVDPRGAQVPLLLIVGAELLVIGLLRMEMALDHKGTRGWSWPFAGGLLAVLIAAVVLSETGTRAFWILALAISAELLINTWSMLFYGQAARIAGKRAAFASLARREA